MSSDAATRVVGIITENILATVNIKGARGQKPIKKCSEFSRR